MASAIGTATSELDNAVARSSGDNQSLTDRLIAGKFGPSAIPRMILMVKIITKPKATPVKPMDNDHRIDIKKSVQRAPNRSAMIPPKNVITKYPIPNDPRINPF